VNRFDIEIVSHLHETTARHFLSLVENLSSRAQFHLRLLSQRPRICLCYDSPSFASVPDPGELENYYAFFVSSLRLLRLLFGAALLAA
jgi:hypothetical protein